MDRNNENKSGKNGNDAENTKDKKMEENNCKLPKTAYIANSFKETKKDKWLWNPISQSWYSYDEKKGIWAEMSDEEIQGLVQDELEQNPKTAGNYSSNYIKDILTLLKSHLVEKDWNKRKDLLPVKNGVVDLETKALLPHSLKYRFTQQLPYNYDHQATCKPIEEWLLEIMNGDEKLVRIILAVMNAIIKGRYDLQKFPEFIGPPATGKSTCANLIIALVGLVNTHSTKLKKLEKNNFENANVHGKKLIYIADSEEYKGDAATLKAIIGEDLIPYERKYKQGGKSFVYQGMVLIVGNSSINFKNDEGKSRRRVTIPFNQQHGKSRNLIDISNANQVEEEFAEYLPGLLNLVLSLSDEEVTELLSNTEELVAKVQETKIETLLDNNPIAAWIDECIVINPTEKTFLGGKQNDANNYLYPSFVQYCQNNGFTQINSNQLTTKMLSVLKEYSTCDDIKKGRDGRKGIYIEGVRLRTKKDELPRPLSDTINVGNTDSPEPTDLSSESQEDNPQLENRDAA